MARKKVLLMGKAHSGKTSMRSIIFANYLARDTMRLSPTLELEHHHVKFLGDLVLNLWDCGGQDAFYESYFERDRETIFRSVELLIYVFDIESDCARKDFEHFEGVLEAIEENSPDARIFVLIHKMDLVVEEHQREFILEERRRLIEQSCADFGVRNFQCFGTSIWDETLYKAWSEIVTNLIPNIGLLKSQLDDFCRICDADEVVLFERETFLVVSHAQANHKRDHVSDVASSQNNNNAPNDMSVSDDNPAIGSIVSSGLGALNSTDDNNMIDPSKIDDKNMQTIDNSVSNQIGTDNSESIGTASNNTSSNQLSSLQAEHASMTNDRKVTPYFDAHRFEKISNIVKQFKLSCGKAQSQFQGMQVRNSRFSAFIDAFTVNTYIMVIVSDPNVHSAAILLNIRNARRHFELFIPRS